MLKWDDWEFVDKDLILYWKKKPIHTLTEMNPVMEQLIPVLLKIDLEGITDDDSIDE